MHLFIIYALSMHIYACDSAKDVCSALCKSDGDKAGVMIEGACYCANPRPNTIIKLGEVRGKSIIPKNYGDY